MRSNYTGTWSTEDAKARFSELLERNRLKKNRPATLRELLVSPEPKIDLTKFIPPRGQSVRRRPGVKFD